MTDDRKDPEQTAGSGRAVKIALFASLAVNLVIAGIVAGAMIRPDGPAARRGELAQAFDAGVGPFGHAMTRDQRRGLAERIGRSRGEFTDSREQMRTHVTAMLDVLRAAPFNQARLRNLLVETQTGMFHRQQLGTEAVLAEIASMSDAERAEFADRLENALRRMRRRP